jgi:hypothetical protein
MRKVVIIIAMILVAFSSCNSKNKSQNDSEENVIDIDSLSSTTDEYIEDELILDVTGWRSYKNKKVFFLVEKDNGSFGICDWSKLIIYNDQVIFDWLDMEPFTFGIKEITYLGDSIIKYQRDKQSSGIIYNNTIEWGELRDTDKKFGKFIRNNNTFVWKIFYNEKLFKWSVIDSLDASRLGLPFFELDDDDDYY